MSQGTRQEPTSPKFEERAPLAIQDVQQLGLFASILSLGYVFWVVGGMEMVERLAYYGVKAVATLYAKDPVSKGGLGITMTTFGTILTVWALIQSIVPVLVGGLADRLGYKKTIALSTVVKIGGYLTMAAFPTFWGFFAGAVLLAFGTGIFKPGIQGTLVKCTNRRNSSMAWGIFYQTVNIGGFLGPLLAGFMRKMAWSNVFLACAAIICLNFLLLLCYKEPGLDERLERQRKDRAGKPEPQGNWFQRMMHFLHSLVADSAREFCKPHVLAYVLIFSGFWFMFMSLFDILPAYIDDWVNTSDIVATVFGGGVATNEFVKFFVVMSADGKHIQPEGMLNVNAGLIMTSCFLFAFLSSRMKALNSMLLGTLLASASMFAIGYSVLGWICLGAIAIFSVGEMMASPKFNEFIGNFAPADKKAMYLGFSQASLAIGWTLEGQFAPRLYDHFASKDAFARELLTQKGMAADAVAAIPQGEAFQKLVDFLGQSPEAVTAMLYQSHDVGMVWLIMGLIGVVSALGILAYSRWIRTLKTL
ncbi:MAG: MFS transporter [Candidatus Eremiobacterota bacterium]